MALLLASSVTQALSYSVRAGINLIAEYAVTECVVYSRGELSTQVRFAPNEGVFNFIFRTRLPLN